MSYSYLYLLLFLNSISCMQPEIEFDIQPKDLVIQQLQKALSISHEKSTELIDEKRIEENLIPFKQHNMAKLLLEKYQTIPALHNAINALQVSNLRTGSAHSIYYYTDMNNKDKIVAISFCSFPRRTGDLDTFSLKRELGILAKL